MALDRAARLLAAVERDGPTCIWCGRTFTAQVRAQHRARRPAGQGRPVLAGERGRRLPPVQLRARAHRTGRVAGGVRAPRLAARRGPAGPACSTALAGAIAVRGGQRRARPYLDAQLRRLRRRGGPAVRVASGG